MMATKPKKNPFKADPKKMDKMSMIKADAKMAKKKMK
jgi:hypothetical protein